MGPIEKAGLPGADIVGKVKRWEFIGALCLVRGWKVGLEIGVSTGRFTLYLMEKIAGSHMTCIDPWTEQAPREDVLLAETYTGWNHEANFKRLTDIAAKHYPGRIRIIRDFSSKVADQIEDGSLDFVFIDGDHTYEGAKGDILAYGPKVRRGGLISGHDINWPTVRQAVHEANPRAQIGPDNTFFWIKR
jgi:predicted O-methyltransferase YrrM